MSKKVLRINVQRRAWMSCPLCQVWLHADETHGVLVDCLCGADLVVRCELEGYRLSEARR